MSETTRHPGSVSLSYTNPRVTRRRGGHGLWFAAGLSAAGLERLATAPDPATIGDEVVDRDRDASVVYVALNAGTPTQVIAWKGLVSVHEVFYARLPDGGFRVSDHFRNVVAVLPPAQRTMSDQALLEHYVGAATATRTTYSRGVDRLGHGDRVDIDLTSGTVSVRVFSRHRSIATDEPASVYLDRLDGALEDVIGPLRNEPGLAVAFSGGVDSTLLTSYLDGTGTPLTVVPGCPEFDAETEYAREAARLIGRTAHEIRLREDDYVEQLEHAITTIAMPLESYVTPTIDKMYEYDSPVFLVGEGADSMFGSGRGIRRLASMLSSGPGRGALRLLEAAPGPIGSRAEQIGGYAALFAHPRLSPAGYAATTLQYHGDLSGTEHIFGREAIEALSTKLMEDVLERVELETSDQDGFFGHIELSQWRLAFADLATAANHSAQALGKAQAFPYLSWRVISEHLKVPAKQRYYRRFTGKWMLKELLARRVPEYEVNKRKLATGLPFARYVENGPLTGFWDRYEIPSVIPEELHDEVRNRPTPLTWKAITHAVWEERVVADLSLAPHPAAVEVTVSPVGTV